ncbi:MAG: outer membrane protein assembly factor BamB [Candidatus Paceibacteria bacterium]|jgi:outer membrane protein assembly factor BamB
MIQTLLLSACSTLLLSSAVIAVEPGPQWPAWRGPDGTGLAAGKAPQEWSADKNIAWKRAIEGRGISTPIVWGDKMFLTTAIPQDEAPTEPEPEQEGGRPQRSPGGALVDHNFDILCLDKNSGEELWRKTAITATPHEGYHRTYGSFASSSPVTDGKHLYVFFGSRGMYCYDLDGDLKWSTDFDIKMEMRNQFGEGVSPVVFGEFLVLNFDQEGPSFIAVLDKNTGKEVWRKDRDEVTSWAAPLVTTHNDRSQVIVSGTTAVRSYAIENGEILWHCSGLGLNAIPTPVRVGDNILIMTGYREQNLMSIALGGKGDLSETDAVQWSSTKGTSYTASPVYHDGLYYTVSDRGLISCFDAVSGDPQYLEERLPRGFTLKASPVATSDTLYVLAEEGEVALIEMGPELLVKAVIPALEEAMWLASPIIDAGNLYLRSTKHLYCIREAGDE